MFAASIFHMRWPVPAHSVSAQTANVRWFVLRPDADDETRAIDLFAKFADQQISFTDCVSFVLMRRNRLERAFTFDRHFADAGFDLMPRS